MHYYRVRRHGDPNKRLRRANGDGEIRNNHFYISRNNKQVGEHIVIAERVLGRSLKKGIIVHHVNENGMDNRNENLVICDRGLHNIIHGRMKAMKATGDPHKKPCRYCKQYDDAKNLTKNGTSHYHKTCNTAYYRRLRVAKMEV